MIRPNRFRVEIIAKAQRQILAAPAWLQDGIRREIRLLSEDPLPANSLAMTGKGRGFYRLRVGGYRVVYLVQPERRMVIVIRVGPRSDVYGGFE